MKYYAITGRIPGDDEDTCWCSGQLETAQEAMDQFTAYMIELDGMDEADVEAMRINHGTAVFINSVVASATQIEVWG